MDKIILVGHPGSQVIIRASKYLTNKYLSGFDITYLNYEGEIHDWSKYVRDYLLKLDDKYVILALDDYLLSAPIDMRIYTSAKDKLGGDTVCVKLCKNTPEELESYPVTTQYCIWNREFLIKLLSVTKDPWDFEIRGSNIFRALNKKTIVEYCLDYPTNSALSSRWWGIKTTGNNPEDIKYLEENEYI